MKGRTFIVVGAILGGLGVAAGAFGAHALERLVTEARLNTFQTAVKYHLIHAVVLVLIGVVLEGGWSQMRKSLLAGYLIVAGIVLFSGSLYVLVLTDTAWLGAITPFGGVAFIVGWALLAWSAWNGGDGTTQTQDGGGR